MKQRNFLHRALSLMLAALLILSLTGSASAEVSSNSPYANLGLDLSEHRDILMYVISDRPAAMDEVLEIVNRDYMEPWLNTTLSIEFLPWGVASTKYPLLLQGGESFDLIYTAAWMGYSGHAQNGAFLELISEFLQKYLPFSYNDQPSTAWDQASISGKIYGVPRSAAEFNTYNMLLIRQDLLEKYGIQTLSNWDDTIEAFKVLAANEGPNGMYVIAQRAYDEMLYPWWQKNNISYLTSGYNFIFNNHDSDELPAAEDLQFMYLTDEFYQYCEQMAELAALNVWSPNVLNDQTDVSVQFESGRTAALIWNSSINPCGANMEANGIGTYAIYDITPDAKASRGSYADGMMSIPATCKDPERAMLALDLMRAFPEVNRLLLGGIEGRHWILREDGYREIGPEAEAYPWGGWAWGLNRYDDPKLYNEDARQLFFESTCEKKEIQPKSAGFTFDPSNVETEISVVQSIVDEYSSSLTLGLFGDELPQKYEEFVNQLYAAGIDSIMNELRQQYQAYCNK